jgi:hypothetical protein
MGRGGGDSRQVKVATKQSDYVYFEDPYVRRGKGFMPRETFDQHWPHVMGGDLEKAPKLIHLKE